MSPTEEQVQTDTPDTAEREQADTPEATEQEQTDTPDTAEREQTDTPEATEQEQTGAPDVAEPADMPDAAEPAQRGDPRDPAHVELSGEDGDAATGAALQAAASPLPPEDAEDPLVIRRNRARRVRTVDFSQPTKFTAELRRRIVRVLGPFCEAFAIRLSSELRASVELAVADASQLTWSAAKAQMSAGAIAVALEVGPIERQMLLSIEPPLILQALECLLGGTASQAGSERRLSDVDWALTRRLLEAMIAQLGPAWRDLGGLQLALGEIDIEGDAGVIAPLGEPTFAVTLESRIDGLPSTMSLLIPWSAIGPAAEDILGGGPKPEDASPYEGRAMHRGLAGAHVQLRAEVGSAQMPVERMLALNPGTLLALEGRAEDGVQLFAEGVPLGSARPGLRGTHRAIKLTAPIEPGRAPAMATASKSAGQAVKPALVGDSEMLDLEATGEVPPDGERAADGSSTTTREGLARMLGVSVRVWAELGRATLALGSALELPPGTVLELDQSADAPIELFVNGMCFAHGTLQVTAEGAWAVQIDTLV